MSGIKSSNMKHDGSIEGDSYMILDPRVHSVQSEPVVKEEVKIDMTLIPSKSLEQIALAMQDGADKYGAFNFDAHTQRAHIAGCLRHLSRYLEGEDTTNDTKLLHLAHAAARLTIALDQALRGVNDDRRKSANK